MHWLRTALVVVGATAFLAGGCGDKEKQDDKAAPKQTDPEVKRKDPPDKKPAPPAAAFDHDTWCNEVFSADDVNRVLGVEGLAWRAPMSKMPAGMADCNVEKVDANKIPLMSAKLMLDCRGMSMDVAVHRDLAKQMAKDGVYRDVDTGKGGAYSKMKAGNMTIYSITYVHETAPCSVTVSTAQLEDDKIEALTAHVVGKVAGDNYPKK